MEKIDLHTITIVLEQKTELGYKGFVVFSDGIRLVVSHETDSNGENLRYYASIEKKKEEDGISTYVPSHGIACLDYLHMQRVCQDFVDHEISLGAKIVG